MNSQYIHSHNGASPSSTAQNKHGKDVEAQNSGRYVSSDAENVAYSPSRPRTVNTFGSRPSQPGIRRRLNAQHTIRAYNTPTGPNLEPGAEPGIDTEKDDKEVLNVFNQVCALDHYIAVVVC